MTEPPTAPEPFFPGVPTEPPTEPLVTTGPDLLPADPNATKNPSRGRNALAVVAGLGLLVAAFLGGRLTAADHTIASLADAIHQAENGSLPCGTITGKGGKALQKSCTQSAAAKKSGTKKKNKSSSGSGSSSSNSSSSSAATTTTTTAPSTSTG